MSRLEGLRIKLFADGAALDQLATLCRHPLIKGFTTNPTLLRQAHVQDYRAFAQEVLALTAGRPVSFEVFSDDFDEMEQQALEIASWGASVYVKVPVTNTRGEFSGPLITRLSAAGVKLNVTAVLTVEQVRRVSACLSRETPSIVSVFAGRIADTGCDPVPLMAEAVHALRACPVAELLWASSRELLNIFQADAIGCQIITATADILAKLPLVGKDLDEYSRETVQMFRRDAVSAGLTLDASQPVTLAGQ